MGQYKLPFYLRVYLEAKKKHPRNLAAGLTGTYGLFVCLCAFQMYFISDTSFLTSLVRSLFLLFSMFACAISAQCFIKRSTDSKHLLHAAVAVSLLSGVGVFVSQMGFQGLLGNELYAQGVLFHSVMWALMIKLDQGMDITLLDQ